MSKTEVMTIDHVEVEEPTRALQVSSTRDLIMGSPVERVQQATEIAKILAPLIRDRRLFTMIQGREYVRYEGWTVLGAMLGVFPFTEWTRPLSEGGWEARVVARTMAGDTVGAAEAMCNRDERNWSDRDEYALRSMAQTRAGGKALRMPLGWIMQLAGYEATPAEEMDAVALEEEKPRRTRVQSKSGTFITDPQVKRLWALAAERAKKLEGVDRTDIVRDILQSIGVTHTAEVMMDSYDSVCEMAKNWEPPVGK